MLTWLQPAKLINLSDPIYSLNLLKGLGQLKSLTVDAWILTKITGEHWLDFVVVKFYSSNFDMSESISVEYVFGGAGPTMGLRELRHTYWGDSGYIPYLDSKTVVAAFKFLSQYYDF